MPNGETLGFDQIGVGEEWESSSRSVTEAEVFAFAGLTGDRNPIHLDPEYARTTPFRRCIAHGLLGLSLAAGLLHDSPTVRTVALLGLREWRFLAPLFPGDTIRVRTRVVSKDLRGRGRRGVVVWRLQVLNQHNHVVQEGVTETVIEANPGAFLASGPARRPAA
jgi:3-hydroxybutyryl-CoA dehydratase